MRKLGFRFAAVGGLLAAVLFFVRRTAWYVSESAAYMSETAEFVESVFWAAILMLGVGLLLVLISLFKKPAAEDAEEEEELYEESYEEPYEESYEEPYGEGYAAPYPAEPYDYDTEADEPYIELYPDEDLFAQTQRVPDVPDPARNSTPEENWTCAICGCRNPDFSRICAVCGAARGSQL